MDLNNIKANLLAEKEELLTEIKKIAVSNNGDFVAKETNTDLDDVLDDVDQADEQTNLINNEVILKELESRLNNIDSALTRIEAGTYGICTDCQKKIDEKRISVNLAAKKCIECAKKNEN